MTKEEAIRVLDPETRRETMRQIPVFERIDADQEACRIAVAALRAQQYRTLDRSRLGCDKCDPKFYEFTGINEGGVYFCARIPEEDKFLYCPHCGRPLTEEARAELERRIGGIESQ